jgi:hypothetical protein
VDETQIAATAPVLAGGTIVAGTYDLTAASIYTGPGGATGPTGHRMNLTIEVTASSLQFAEDNYESLGCTQEERSSTYTISGATLISNTTCPEVHSDSIPFAATATTLTIAPEAATDLTFTKR